MEKEDKGAYVHVLACELWTLYPYAVVGYGVRGPDDHHAVSTANTELYVTVQREAHTQNLNHLHKIL